MLSTIPADIRRYIFGYLRPSDLLRLSSTNRLFYEYCSEEELWKAILSNRFDDTVVEHVAVLEKAWKKEHKKFVRLKKCYWKHVYLKSGLGDKLFIPEGSLLSGIASETAYKLAKEYSNATPEKCLHLGVIGPGGAGKSAFVVQFINGVFVECYDPTIEDCYHKQVDPRPDCVMMVRILDAVYESSCWGIPPPDGIPQDYRKYDVWAVLFAIDDLESFKQCKFFLQLVQKLKVPFMLVGSKADRARNREVLSFEAISLATEYKIPYLETSSKTRKNNFEAFYTLIRLAGAAHASTYTDAKATKDSSQKCNVM